MLQCTLFTTTLHFKSGPSISLAMPAVHGALLHTPPKPLQLYPASISYWNQYLESNMAYTSIYTYIPCTYSVHAGMYFVHNHTSLQSRSYQPCDAGESQLRAADGAVKAHCSLSWCLPWNPVVIQVKSVYTSIWIQVDCTVYSIIYTIP